MPLDSRFRGNDRSWGVQRGEAPLRFFSSPKTGGQGADRANLYHRITLAAQVKPAPKDTIIMIWPSFIRPCSNTSLRAMGSDAAVVFPYR